MCEIRRSRDSERLGSHRAECCLCRTACVLFVVVPRALLRRTLSLSSFRHAAPAHRPGNADKRRPDLPPLLDRALRCDAAGGVGRMPGSGRPSSLTGHQLANRCLDAQETWLDFGNSRGQEPLQRLRLRIARLDLSRCATLASMAGRSCGMCGLPVSRRRRRHPAGARTVHLGPIEGRNLWKIRV
jgi:hypothetical protein